MNNYDIVVLMAHVILACTVATMLFSIFAYIASRRRTRKPAPRPADSGAQAETAAPPAASAPVAAPQPEHAKRIQGVAPVASGKGPA